MKTPLTQTKDIGDLSFLTLIMYWWNEVDGLNRVFPIDSQALHVYRKERRKAEELWKLACIDF